MKFNYLVSDSTGNLIKGNIIAKDKEEVKNILKKSGNYIIRIKKQSILQNDIKFNKQLSKVDISLFCRHLHFFISSGVNISNINLITTTKVLNKELLNLKQNILKGESISNAINNPTFTPLLYSMVKVGEETGNLPHILEKMEIHYENQSETEREIKSMLIYPIIVLITMAITIFITMVYLVPSFMQMFISHNIDLPPITIVLINISNFLTSWLIIIPLIIILLIIILLKLRVFDKFLFKLPIIKKIMYFSCYIRFTSAMSIMLDTGVPILKAIRNTSTLFNNKYYSNIIINLEKDLQTGIQLSKALEKSVFFSPLLISMVQLGESTGTITKSLQKCNKYYEKEQHILVTRIKKQIEPAITIILGAILLFVILAIMLPTFAITGAL